MSSGIVMVNVQLLLTSSWSPSKMSAPYFERDLHALGHHLQPDHAGIADHLVRRLGRSRRGPHTAWRCVRMA